MPTCNDCIHQELCNIYANAGVITDVPADDITICEVFKNKADVVEVVRCKDCIDHNVPPCPMRLSLNWTNDNDFCSYGERRSDEALSPETKQAILDDFMKGVK